MNKIKLLTTLILGSVISCGDSMSMDDSIELPTNSWDAGYYCQQVFKRFPDTVAHFNRDFGAFAYSMWELLKSSNLKSALSFMVYSIMLGKRSALPELEIVLKSYQGDKRDAFRVVFRAKHEETLGLILGGYNDKAADKIREELEYATDPNEIRDIQEIIGKDGTENILGIVERCKLLLPNRRYSNPYAMRSLANEVIGLKAGAILALQALIENKCWLVLGDVVIKGDPRNQLVQKAFKALIKKENWWILANVVRCGNPKNQLHQDALNYLITNQRCEQLIYVVKKGNSWNQLYQNAFNVLVENGCLEKLRLIEQSENPFVKRAIELLDREAQKTD